MKRTRKQAGKMAKQKGAQFERFVAKLLGKWWGSKFYRTPMSGGSQLKDGFNMAGDLCTDDPSFPFHVECKKQEQWGLHQLFVSKSCKPWAWWKQCTNECPDGQIPLLIMTKNRYPVWAMLRAEHYDRIGAGIPAEIRILHDGTNLMVIPLMTFFDVSKPTDWRG